MSQILIKRIIKLISMHYALNEDELFKEYEKVGSIDTILEAIQNKEIK